MVRDPFAQVVSSYLYHRQENPPHAELETTQLQHPCVHNAETLQKFAHGVQHVSMHSLEKIIKLCVSLYPKGKYTQYHQALKTLPPHDGVRLEAARLTIAHQNGDVLRMVHNAMRLRKHAQHPSEVRTHR